MGMVWANVRGALEQIWSHKLRSFLTVLGMVIAVSSTICVVSVVRGFSTYAVDLLQELGTNMIWVWPDRPSGEAGQRLGRIEMDIHDVEEIERRCAALRGVSTIIRQPDVKVRYGREKATVARLDGISAEYHAIRRFYVNVGRPFAVIDVERAHHVCVVGREVLRKLNTDEDLVGQSILLEGQRFRVTGILEEIGSQLGINQDDHVLIPHTLAVKMFPAQRRKVAFAAQAASASQVPEARSQIVNLLRRRHRLEAHQPNDFKILVQDEFLSAFNSLSLVATAMLAGIVGISLLVGGIGIMNVMLVGVTERTREIGLRKAVGARRRDILLQFLTESVVLSVAGGAAGIAMGYAFSALASLHPQMIDIIVPGWAVGLGFGISAGTGVVFGLLPAVKAALLNPIDALRSD